jgi:hypothetical protein
LKALVQPKEQTRGVGRSGPTASTKGTLSCVDSGRVHPKRSFLSEKKGRTRCRAGAPRLLAITTARALRARKTGGLRCGQEDHGSQAPYSRRYARPVVERSGSSRQYSGLRWGGTGADRRTSRWIPFIERIYSDDRLLDNRDRRTLVHRRRIRGRTQAALAKI